MNRKYPHFAIPEIYGDSLSYYELLRKLVTAMNVMIDNYDTIPDQIAEAVANLDASQLFSAVLDQIIDSIATDNTKSTNAVKVYKKHDLLYATFNETVNLYESLIDFTAGTETKLIIGTNIREVNISELFIELRKLIDDEAKGRVQADTTLQRNIDNEAHAREQADTNLQNAINTEKSAREQADTSLQRNIDSEARTREQADTSLQRNINSEARTREQADTDLQNNINNGTLKIDLLWQNQNIEIAFNQQNVTLSKNAETYKYICIVCAASTTNSVREMNFIKPDGKPYVIHVIRDNFAWRFQTICTNNRISFGDGLLENALNQSVCIPAEIYGIK